MKLLKAFGVSLLCLAAVITLISLLMPSKVLMTNTVLISAPMEKIYVQLRDLDNWKQWHPVFKNDSNSITISKPSSSVNSFAEWKDDGNTFRLTIIQDDVMLLKAILSKNGRKEIENQISVITLQKGNLTEVEWLAVAHLRWYPWEKFSGIFMDKLAGPGYAAALNNLKILCEK